MSGDEIFDVAHVPHGHAGTNFEGLRELTGINPAPDCGGADRQDAGFLGRSREVRDTDDARLHLTLHKPP